MNKRIRLTTVYDDAYLSFLEGKRHIPFFIKRIYFIHSCISGLDRGHHAHKKTHQIIFCLRGSFDLFLDDGKHKKLIHLDNPQEGVEIPPLVWHEMKNISSDALLLVVASEYYNEKDYLRTYEVFRRYIAKKSKNTP